jgi:beta-glucanase (GH16 family)
MPPAIGLSRPSRSVTAIAASCLALAITIGPAAVSGPAQASVGVTSSGTESTSWKLAWADYFDGAAGTPPNPANWGYETGGGGWGSDQAQYYTDSTQNAALDGNGDLAITARQNTGSSLLCSYNSAGTYFASGTACGYTSARLSTLNSFSAQYGRIEARIEIPEGDGLWPAFWAVGTNESTVGWPESGEIDTMENIGEDPGTAFGTLHGPLASNAADQWSSGSTYTLPGGAALGAGFHIFAADWYPDHISFSVDGHIYETVYAADLPSGDTWVFNHPFFLRLNLAVGSAGSWGGAPASSTAFPATMLVDYVRVYTATTPPADAAGPVTGIDSKCVDDYGAGTTNGGKIDLYACNGTKAQNWTIATDGTVRALGGCLTASGSGTAAHTAIVWDTCNGSSGQQWRIESDGSLLNPGSGLCLDDTSSVTTNGNALQLYPCNGTSAQIWTYPVPPADDWPLNDGTGTTATDTANGLNATLTGGASWTTDPSRGVVLDLSGASQYAVASGPAVSTAASFTVSAWVNLATAGSGLNSVAVAQDGAVDSGFFLEYNDTCCGGPGWGLASTSTDTAPPTWNTTAFSAGAATGTWTMLTAVYSASAHTAALYVNGALKATATGVAAFSATGPLTIGRSQDDGNYGDFFPGKISDVQVFGQPLTSVQVGALYSESPVD